MARASGFWNGINSLIVPVNRRGQFPPSLASHLEARGIEQLFVHQRLSDTSMAKLGGQFRSVARMWDRLGERELHPLHLFDASSARQGMMIEPKLPNRARMRRLKLACWGEIPEEDRSHWKRVFSMHLDDTVGPSFTTFLNEQATGRTPLFVGCRYMGAFNQTRPTWERHLWIFGGATFNELVTFWNYRARMAGWDGRPHMLGLPREALATPTQLAPLLDWIAPRDDEWVKPDIIVSVPPGEELDARAAFEELGLIEYNGNIIRHGFGTQDDGRQRPEFQLAGPMISGAMQRGTTAWTLATFTGGKVSLDLPVPDRFRVSRSRLVRIELHNLPLPLPANDRLAQAILPAARATLDGVGFSVYAGTGPWAFDLSIPSGWDALRLWGEGLQFDIARSQPGRYGEALLARLGGLKGLQVLASEQSLAVLGQLTPQSAKKLAQHLVGIAGSGGLDENHILQLIRTEPLWMELHARTLAEMRSKINVTKRELLSALAKLTCAGFIRRGRALRCPVCNYGDWLALGEIDERVRCRACGTEYPLAVADPGATREAETYYRLDGLMARCMDQDLLPVLLALRHTQRLDPTIEIQQAWPGLLFTRDGREVEIDLLVSTGQRVHIFECKLTADRLSVGEAKRLVETAVALKAIPTAAGLTGEFGQTVRKIITDAGGACLERRHLLTDNPASLETTE